MPSPADAPSAPNPFFVGKPVPFDRFIGRKKELLTAFDQIDKRNHLGIYGAPGIGKSSFLSYLLSPEAWKQQGKDMGSWVIVSTSCDAVVPFTPSSFWAELIRLIRDQPGIDDATRAAATAALGHPAPWDKKDLVTVVEKLGASGKSLLLLLDDYEVALRTSVAYTEMDRLVFLSEFRNLAVNTAASKYLATVLSSHRKLNELGPNVTPAGSPWYNHYIYRALKPFGDGEVGALFDRMPQGFALTATQRDGIQDVAGALPALLQHACYAVYEDLADGAQPSPETVRRFVDSTDYFFHDAWALSTDVEQMLMMLIALDSLGGRVGKGKTYALQDLEAVFSQRDRELRDLEERAVLRRLPFSDAYGFVSSAMEWWVIKEIENARDESELGLREKVLVGLSRKQVQQVTGVLKQVWANKDAIAQVASWLGKLVGAFAKGAAGG